MNGIYTDPKCTDCTKIYRCEAAHTKPQHGENYDCFEEKEEITRILGYCPSPDMIIVRLHPENEEELRRQKAARLAEELAKEEYHERRYAEKQKQGGN